jgi:hypothetical protein
MQFATFAGNSDPAEEGHLERWRVKAKSLGKKQKVPCSGK